MFSFVTAVVVALASAALASFDPSESIGVMYVLSDGFDYRASIELRPDGRFEFLWEGCTGLIAHVNGNYVSDSSSVTFDPGGRQFERNAVTFADTMIRVRWARREYLIPQERLLAFVNAINAGREPRTSRMGVFYLRKGDELVETRGSPDLPEEWRSYILSASISGKVLRVLQRESATTRPLVVLDAGSQKGLRPGMELFSFNTRRPSFKAYLVIESVTPDTATAKVTLQYRHIRTGDAWSTLPVR